MHCVNILRLIFGFILIKEKNWAHKYVDLKFYFYKHIKKKVCIYTYQHTHAHTHKIIIISK